MEDNDFSRRRFLQAGTALTTALAGCSGGGDGESTPRGTETTESSSNNQETDNQNNSATSSSNTSNTGDSQDSVGQDQVHDGEDWLEEYMSSSSNDAGTTLGQSEYHWIEFEHVDEEIDTAVYNEIFSGLGYLESGELPTGEFEVFYIAIGKENPQEPEMAEAYLIPENWVSDGDVLVDNYENSFYSGGFLPKSKSELETLFSEGISDYDDVSEDFPQEYLDLIES